MLREEDFLAVPANELLNHKDKKVWIKGYLITAKKTATSNGDTMYFGTFLDVNGHWLDTVHFPQIAHRFPFRGKGIYQVYGTVIIEYECVSIEVEFMKKMGVIEDPRYSEAGRKRL